MPASALSIFAIWSALLALAALWDFRKGVVPNKLVAVVLPLSLALGWISDPQFSAWQHGLVFAIVLVVGITAFAFRIMGGGAVKLAAAISILLDPGEALLLLPVALICSGILTFVTDTLHRTVPSAADSDWACFATRGDVHFAPAIAIAGFLIALWSFAPPSAHAAMVAPEPHLLGLAAIVPLLLAARGWQIAIQLGVGKRRREQTADRARYSR